MEKITWINYDQKKDGNNLEKLRSITSFFLNKMDPEYRKEGFKNLSIKTSIANKFISYSKKITKSRSLTLLLMLEFFENNNVSPTEYLGPNMKTLERAISKRINSLIAIIRDIEQTQTLPTKAMLESLFEELPESNPKNAISSFQDAFKNLEISTPTPLVKKSSDDEDIRKLLRNIELIKTPFGKTYFKVHLKEEEIERLKIKYHVYHD